MTIKEKLAKCSDKERSVLKDITSKKVDKFMLELSQMLEDGELSNTAAKEVFREFQETNTWKYWMAL